MSGFGAAGADGPQLTFGSAAAQEGSTGLSFGSTLGAPDFAAGAKFGAPLVAPSSEGAAGEENGEEKVPEAESTAEFVPVVQLEEVDVKTHEEDEEVTFKMRAKLFRFTETLLNKGSGKKEWIERGVGEMKLLKHRESEMIRVLMRQEKTMKVIANHVVDPRIEMAPNVGSDRSWVWSVYDFSEGELVEEVFAIRFGNAENATKFLDAFKEAQKAMEKLKGGADAGEDAAADEAAEALSSLKATEEEAPAPAADTPEA